MRYSNVKVHLSALKGSTMSIQMMSIEEATALRDVIATSTNMVLTPIFEGLREELEKVEDEKFTVSEVFTYTVKAKSHDEAIDKVRSGDVEADSFADYDADIVDWED